MAYRHGYRRRRRGGSSLGSAVGDVGAIANRFGPRGAFIAGVTGFITFYWLLPALLTMWAESNKARMAGPSGQVMGKVLDEVFLRRFINPCEWVGIAMLILCSGIAAWKLYSGESLSRPATRDAGFFAKLLARFLD